MPIYEFECDLCGSIKSVSQSIDAPAPQFSCDSCQIIMMRKWSSPAIHFKGDGWGGSK